MNVEFFDVDFDDQIGNILLVDGKGKMNFFRVMCEFIVIESNVYKKFYFMKVIKQFIGEFFKMIGEFDEQLEEWKDCISIDF